MSDAVELWEQPEDEEIYMFLGWRQWADAGSTSSGLIRYLVKHTDARQIGNIKPDGFYMFQIPGTHDLVRPVVKFNEGYPESLEDQRNELFYASTGRHGLVYFLGDEPHLDAERYVDAILHVARTLKVKRIISFGGVYGELPYDKDRMISSTYSLPELKAEVEALSVNLSDYNGGASISSYICHRAGQQGIEYVSFYGFVPIYDFSTATKMGNTIRIENDFMAWLGIMQRVNHMLRLNIDLNDLEARSAKLVALMDAKVEELDSSAPQLGVRDYLKRLSNEFDAEEFDPLDDIWEDELRRLSDKFDPDEE